MDAYVMATLDDVLEKHEQVANIVVVRQLERLEARRAELSQRIQNCHNAMQRTTNLKPETTETFPLIQTAAKVI